MVVVVPGSRRRGPKEQAGDEQSFWCAELGRGVSEPLGPSPIAAAGGFVGPPEVGRSRWQRCRLIGALLGDRFRAIVVESGFGVIGELLVPGHRQKGLIAAVCTVGSRGQPEREPQKRMADPSCAFVEITCPVAPVNRRSRTALLGATGH